VVRFANWIPEDLKANLRVLDYACGRGRHIRFLENFGCQILGMDCDQEAIDHLSKSINLSKPDQVELRYVDLELDLFAIQSQEKFAAVVVTNYLYRPHLLNLIEVIAPKGLLIYETFAIGNEIFGKPSNPDYLLVDNELIELVMHKENFKVLAFEHLKIDDPKPAIVQRICAMRTK
jgi:SAM-dependent methyltransferase